MANNGTMWTQTNNNNSNIIKAKADLATLYFHMKETVLIKKIFESLGHKQPLKPIHTDDMAGDGITNNNIQVN